ncbi:MAG: carboxymuconolactone decarboxylase family protein [Phycisphaerae bacterium]|nr:carboxymuconolactone decarboxylase family protein [Phycisphaerae bacterium]
MNSKEFLEKFANDVKKMQEKAKPTMDGFSFLFKRIMTEGALTVREKEFIALGIGLAKQCEPCIILHVKKCLDAGASPEEIIEAASVAVLMGGGPAYTHLPLVIETLEELA